MTAGALWHFFCSLCVYPQIARTWNRQRKWTSCRSPFLRRWKFTLGEGGLTNHICSPRCWWRSLIWEASVLKVCGLLLGPHLSVSCHIVLKRKNEWMNTKDILSLKPSLQELNVSSPWKWRSPAPCPLSSRRCWRTQKVWKAGLQAAGPVVPPLAAAVPVCPPALPKAVQPHNRRSSGPPFYFFLTMLSVSSLDVLKRRDEGGGPWPWLLNTGDRQSQPPPLSQHQSPPPDLLSLTREHRPDARGGKAGAGRGNRMPPRDHTVNTADDSTSFSLHSPLHCCSSPLHFPAKD